MLFLEWFLRMRTTVFISLLIILYLHLHSQVWFMSFFVTKKIGPDWFSRFDVYSMQTKNRQVKNSGQNFVWNSNDPWEVF